MDYQQAKRTLEGLKCSDCNGRGTQNDCEPGDTSFSEWTCPSCNGSGVARGASILIDVEV
jgi:DnaJ-class molecular chaperone